MSLTLKCELDRLYYSAQNSDFKVMLMKVVESYTPCPSEVSVGSKITAAGECPDDYLRMRVPLKVSGEWTNTKYGKQLKLSEIIPIMPNDSEGIYQYLSSGVIKGIGPQTARRLVERFGSDTLSVIDKDPSRILEIKGIGEKTVKKVVSSWKEQREMAELLTNLCGMGLSLAYARRVHRAFGPDAVAIIKENPYRLTEVPMIGFLKADEIALKQGVEYDSPYRVRAAIKYAVENATYTAGHCYLPVLEVIDAVSKLNVSRQSITREIDQGEVSGVYIENDRLYLTNIYRAERYVARRLNEMAYQVFRQAPIAGWRGLTEEQAKAVSSALQRRLVCITGLPGTGKTTSVMALVDELEKKGMSYVLAAPTGKAAKRLSEQTGKEAKTIHRLLECSRTGTFNRNEDNPLETDYVIIDEVSMIDVLLMESLLRAVQGKTRVVLIGDYNQLPSVGPGNVLRDIVDERLCQVEVLTKIYRQAETSTIVRIAHEVNRGEIPSVHKTQDYEFINIEEQEKIFTEIIQLVKKHSPDAIQVLTPMNKGLLGVNNLNNSIREAIYSEECKKPFLKGDRVIQRINNYDKMVFNGEVGRVIEVSEEDNSITVLFDDHEVVYEDYETDELSHAYALTVHRSQGSEYDFVIMPLSIQHYIMLYRNLLYTGITRAKKNLVLVGNKKALYIAVRNDRPVKRYTTLGTVK